MSDRYGDTEGGTGSPTRAKVNFDIINMAVNNSSFGIVQRGIKTSGIQDGGECVLTETRNKRPGRMQADAARYTNENGQMTAACYKTILAESKKSRVHFNELKCALLPLNVDFEAAKEEWAKIQKEQNIALGVTKKIKYLGATLTGEKDQDLTNVMQKIGAGNGSLRLIAGAGLNQQRLCDPRIRVQMVHSYVVSRILAGLDAMRLSGAAEERLRQHGDKLMRKTFMFHSNASTHLTYLVSGKLRLNVYHRLGQINLLLRVLALGNQLTDALRWDFFHQTRNSWVYQVCIALTHYSIKNVDRWFYGNVITTENARSVYVATKELVEIVEFENTKRQLLSQKWVNNFDLSACRPGKPSRHIMGASTSQEIRGISVQLQFLGQTYLTSTLTNRNSICAACGEGPDRDTPANVFRCPKAHVALALKKELLDSLPQGHPIRGLPLESPILTRFILDPLSQLNGYYTLYKKPGNYAKIQSLARLISFFYHQNRAIAIRKMKKKDPMFGRYQWKKRDSNQKVKRKSAVSFLEI